MGSVARAVDEDEQRVGEQAGDDRRDAGHDVDEARDDFREAAAIGIFDEVDRREEAERNREDRRQRGDDQGADDRVVSAAALADLVGSAATSEYREAAASAVATGAELPAASVKDGNCLRGPFCCP